MSHLGERFGIRGEKGSAGEVWMYNKLKERYTVKDYRTDFVLQTQGIDFGISLPAWRREFTLDVKTNLYTPPENWYGFKLELQRANKAGWLFTSKADRIYHVNAFQGKYLYYDLNEMRYYITKKLLDNNMDNFTITKIDGDILLQIKIIKDTAHDVPVSNIFY